ncbi:hypothetical protein CC80DRAFT_544561 [Byssothecium circinans]|uniref:Uncharacterized protein n=1 Tax=Byssothecium circinans TaxID=147558 RepID=A0A6A5U5Z5_9PLEO|nr:hypothetical protein CC80DRAFT_544561 [Byssothecium circinans]
MSFDLYILSIELGVPSLSKELNRSMITAEAPTSRFLPLIIHAAFCLPGQDPVLRFYVDVVWATLETPRGPEFPQSWEGKLPYDLQMRLDFEGELPHELLVKIRSETRQQPSACQNNNLLGVVYPCDYHMHESEEERRACHTSNCHFVLGA